MVPITRREEKKLKQMVIQVWLLVWICFALKSVQFLYSTEWADWLFLGKIFDIDSSGRSRALSSFSFDENWSQDSKVGLHRILTMSSVDCKLVRYCNIDLLLAILFRSNSLHSRYFVVKVNSSSLKSEEGFKVKLLLWDSQRTDRATVTVTFVVLVAFGKD